MAITQPNPSSSRGICSLLISIADTDHPGQEQLEITSTKAPTQRRAAAILRHPSLLLGPHRKAHIHSISRALGVHQKVTSSEGLKTIKYFASRKRDDVLVLSD